MEDRNAPIGVFDSGVGGISTLRTLAKSLPKENFIFYGDSANAPYGERPADQVYQLSVTAIDQLRKQGIKALVIACNTATSAAKPQLISRYPDMPILGIEPALKQAVDAGKKDILVMATPLTISRPKYQNQAAKFKDQATIYSLPCPGLADRIELGTAGLPQISSLLDELLARYLDKPIDALVLGCTHYPFVKDIIAEKLDGQIEIYTGYDGIERYLEYKLRTKSLLRTENQKQTIQFMSSRDTPAELALYQSLFDHGIQR